MSIEELFNIANNRENFERLVDLCIGELVVPYVGAGLSDFANKKAGFNNHFYTWWKYLSLHYYDCFKKDLEDNADLYKTADNIADIEQERFYESIRRTYGFYLSPNDWDIILKKSKEEAISVIPQLFKGPIITTNFDQILEKVHDPMIPVYLPHDVDALRKLKDVVKERKHSIFKVHGSIASVDKIIFTGKSYDKAYQSDSNLVRTLSEFYKGFCFLFLGASLKMSENEIDRSVKLWTQLTNTGMSHFAILEYPNDLKSRQEELEKHNIKPIFFPKGRFDLIKPILSEIVKRKEIIFGQVPKYSSKFIGRKNILNQIGHHLSKSNFSIYGLIGGGGVGKTRIMCEYASEMQNDKKYNRIVWFNAISKDVILNQFYKFIEKEGLIAKGERKTSIEIITLIKDWMINNSNWLFLFDNLESYEDIKNLLTIREKSLTDGIRHFIITSRNTTLPFFCKTVRNFKNQESQDFLSSYTKLETDSYSVKIAKKLGRLPLALEQAAAYIKKIRKTNPQFNYTSYLLELEKSFDILKMGGTESRTFSVEATWNTSMRMIENEESKQLLNLCSFFAPNNIDFNWFVEGNDKLKSYPDLQLKFQNGGYLALLKELSEFSLINLSNEGFSIHLMTQDAIKNAINRNEQIEYFRTCVFLMDSLRFNIVPSSESRLKFNKMAYHIHAILESKILISNKEIANLNSFIGNGVRELFADYKAALKYHKTSLQILEGIFGDNAIETALANHNIGRDLYEQGDYSNSIEYYNKALHIREIHLDSNNIDISKSNNDLGLAYHKIGDYEKALKCYFKALDIREHLFRKDHIETASLYNNIGLTYYRKGSYDKALEANNKALNIRINEYGQNSVYVAISYNDIGVIYCAQDRYKEALDSFTNALAIWRKVYGHHQKHSDIALAYNNIGFVLIKLKQYDNALKNLQTALKMRINILTKEHPYTAMTKKNIGLVYYLQGDYERALDFLLEAYFTLEKKLIKDHSDTIETLSYLKKIYEQMRVPTNFENWLFSKRLKY